ncbi:MAG: hypothetical protein AAB487_03030 [Patescibacteria group bacterium]
MKGISGKLLLLAFFLTIGLLVFGSGQAFAMFPTSVPDGVVPCATDANPAPCTLCHFIVGFYNLFKYGLYIVITAAFIAVFFAGTMYVISTGDEGMMTAAKSFLKAALIGFTVVAGAWLIVNITLWLISAQPNLGVGRTNWYTFTCNTASSALTPIPPSP